VPDRQPPDLRRRSRGALASRRTPPFVPRPPSLLSRCAPCQTFCCSGPCAATTVVCATFSTSKPFTTAGMASSRLRTTGTIAQLTEAGPLLVDLLPLERRGFVPDIPSRSLSLTFSLPDFELRHQSLIHRLSAHSFVRSRDTWARARAYCCRKTSLLRAVHAIGDSLHQAPRALVAP
jgi:hypothetical protein